MGSQGIDDLRTDRIPRPGNCGTQRCKELPRTNTVGGLETTYDLPGDILGGAPPAGVDRCNYGTSRDQKRYAIGGPDRQPEASFGRDERVTTPDTPNPAAPSLLSQSW
jgi:hypothetical protein